MAAHPSSSSTFTRSQPRYMEKPSTSPSTIQQKKHKRRLRYLAYPLHPPQVIEFATRDGDPPINDGFDARLTTFSQYISRLTGACSFRIDVKSIRYGEDESLAVVFTDNLTRKRMNPPGLEDKIRQVKEFMKREDDPKWYIVGSE
jgi:hypothetical protein